MPDAVWIFWLIFLSLLCFSLLGANVVQRNKRIDQDIKIAALEKENNRLDAEVRKYERIQAQKSAMLKKRLEEKKAKEDATG